MIDNQSHKEINVKQMVKSYSYYPSTLKINHLVTNEKLFYLPNDIEINKIIQSLNTNKATGPDSIHAKIAKLSANAIDNHLSDVISNDVLLEQVLRKCKICVSKANL